MLQHCFKGMRSLLFAQAFLYGVTAMINRSKRIMHADRILQYLQEQNGPVSAYAILEGLRPDGISASTTVYRALEKLMKARRIHRIESLNAWTVCCGEHDQKLPVFSICDDCGIVTEHIDTDFKNSVASLSEATGFEPSYSVLEIHGRCGDCITNMQTN